MPISPSCTQGYSFGSAAEQKIYEFALREGGFENGDKYLFHSLSMCKTGNKKIKAEVDFVYLDRDCILFLEVKGGEVKYDSASNDWYVMGGSLKADPFKQAYDALYQTRDNLLISLFGSGHVARRLVFGIGVLFPDCIKPSQFSKREISGMEYDPDLIYDFNDTGIVDGFLKYIGRLKRFWSSHAQFVGRNGISHKEESTIANFFRKDLHFKLPVSNLITKSMSEAQSFTNMQMYALDTLVFNPSKGGLIIGGPGTGKTILALELLRRNITSGKKTLFVCYNKNLMEYLRLKINSMELDREYLEVRHIHGLLRDNSYLSENVGDIEDGNEYWFIKLPLFFTKHLRLERVESFDYLIVDEGQDIMNEYQFDALGKLLKGGFESGSFTVFLDKNFQNIYNNDIDVFFDYFREKYPTISIPLQLNCRNTLSTIRSAALQTGLPEMPCMRQENGWKSQLRYYTSEKDLYNQLFDLMSKLELEDISKKHITLLCSEKKQVSDIIAIGNGKFHNVALSSYEKINILTIHSYKGLENEFIITIGPSNYDPDNIQQMQLLYIANTRACSQSIVFLDRKFKYLIEEKYDQIN